MKKQLKVNGHMEVLRIFYILNGMNSCELDDRERRYRNAHRHGFQRLGFYMHYERFQAILEMKSQFHKVLFQYYQKFLKDLV